jgi:hypothetical protein
MAKKDNNILMFAIVGAIAFAVGYVIGSKPGLLGFGGGGEQVYSSPNDVFEQGRMW